MLQLKKLTPRARQALWAAPNFPAVSSTAYYRDCMRGHRALVEKLKLTAVEPEEDPGLTAELALAQLVPAGKSVQQLLSYAKAAKLRTARFAACLAAAEKGSLPAMLETALCYAAGDGVDRRPGYARWWLENAIAIYAELYYWSVE